MNINPRFLNFPVLVDGSLYKIGLRNMVFIKTISGWVRSTKEPKVVIGAIRELK